MSASFDGTIQRDGPQRIQVERQMGIVVGGATATRAALRDHYAVCEIVSIRYRLAFG